jgi:hypothetical protein
VGSKYTSLKSNIFVGRVNFAREHIRTCCLDYLSKFTEEMGDFQVCAKGKLKHHQTVDQGMHSANEQGE